MPNYPARLDTTQSLPTVVDNFTPIVGGIFNKLRDAVIAIETELGVKPSGSYGTVGARLTVLESSLGNLQIISLAGDLGNTLANPQVIGIHGRPITPSAPSVGDIYVWNGVAWALANAISGVGPVGPPGPNSIAGIPVETTTAPILDGYVVTYVQSDNQWEPKPPTGGGGSSFTPGGDLSGSSLSQTVSKLQGNTLTISSLGKSDILAFNGTNFVNRADDYLNILDYGGNGNGVADNTTAFANASTAAASHPSGKIYIPAGSYKLSSNQTISGNLKFAPGAMLKPTSGQTAILAGQIIEADDYQQIFDISLGGALSLPNVSHISPCWFGADPTASIDSQPAIRSAIVAAPTTVSTLYGHLQKKVKFPAGNYMVNKPIVVDASLTQFMGDGASEVNIQGNGFVGPTIQLSHLATMTLHTSQYAGGNTANIGDGPWLSLHRYGPAWMLDGRSAFSLDYIFQIQSTQSATTSLLSSSGKSPDWTSNQTAFNVYMLAADLGYSNTNLGIQWTLKTTSGTITATTNAGCILTDGTFYNLRLDYDGSFMRIFVDGIAQTLTNADTKIAQTGTIVQHYAEGINLGLGFGAGFGGTSSSLVTPPVGCRAASLRFKWISQGSSNYSPPVAKFTEDVDTKFLLNFDIVDNIGGFMFARVYGGTSYGIQDAWIPNEQGSDVTKQISYCTVSGMTVLSNNGPAINLNACPNSLIKDCFLYGQSGALFNENSYNSAIEKCNIFRRGDAITDGGRGFGISANQASNYVVIRDNIVAFFDVNIFNSESFSFEGYNYILSPRYSAIYLEGCFAGNIGGSCFVSDEASGFDNPYGVVAVGCGTLNMEGILIGMDGHSDQIQLLIDNSAGTLTPASHVSIDAVNFSGVPGQNASIQVRHTRVGDEIFIRSCSTQSGVPLLEVDSTTNGNINIDSTGVVAVYSTATIPANFKFAPGAILQPANGVTATLSGEISADIRQQIFNLSLGGLVIPAPTRPFYVGWWGAKGDGITDDIAAIQAAIDALPFYISGGTNSSEVVQVPPGKYIISKPILFNKYAATFLGSGPFATRFQAAPNFMGPMIIAAPDNPMSLPLGVSLVTGPGQSLIMNPNLTTGQAYSVNLRDCPFANLDGLTSFTLEFFIKINPTHSGIGNVISSLGSIYSAVAGTSAFYFHVTGSAAPYNLQIIFNTSSGVANPGNLVATFNADQVYHIAVTYDGTNVKWWVDGNLDTTIAKSGSVSQETYEDMMLGWGSAYYPEQGNTLVPFDGYMDSVRFSNSVRYTTNFTAPSSKFVSDNHTMLLINFDGIYHQCLVADAWGSLDGLGTNATKVYFVSRPHLDDFGLLPYGQVEAGNFGLDCRNHCTAGFINFAPSSYFHDIEVDFCNRGFNFYNNDFLNIIRNVTVSVAGSSLGNSNKARGDYGFAFIIGGINTIDDCKVTSGASAIIASSSSLNIKKFDWEANQTAQIGLILGVGDQSNITGFSSDDEVNNSLFIADVLLNSTTNTSFYSCAFELVAANPCPTILIANGSLDERFNRVQFYGCSFSPSAGSTSIFEGLSPQVSAISLNNCYQLNVNSPISWSGPNAIPTIDGKISRTITTGTSSTCNSWDLVVGINVGTAYNITLPATTISQIRTLPAGKTIIIKDQSGNADVNNITITANSGQTIDGGTDYILNIPRESITLTYDGISDWMVT